MYIIIYGKIPFNNYMYMHVVCSLLTVLLRIVFQVDILRVCSHGDLLQECGEVQYHLTQCPTHRDSRTHTLTAAAAAAAVEAEAAGVRARHRLTCSGLRCGWGRGPW